MCATITPIEMLPVTLNCYGFPPHTKHSVLSAAHDTVSDAHCALECFWI